MEFQRQGFGISQKQPLTFHHMPLAAPKTQKPPRQGSTLEANSGNLRVICLRITNSPAR